MSTPTIVPPTSTTTTVALKTATTRTFHSSAHLAAPRATANAVVTSLPGVSLERGEARYWAEKFGLGGSTKNKNRKYYAHPRQVHLQAGTASMVHQLLFVPNAKAGGTSLAVVCGPRVPFYGTSTASPFHRALSSHSNSNNNKTTIDADKQVPTQGQLALCASLRQGDGQLLAIGTPHQVRVAHVTSRATLVSWKVPLAVRGLQWLRNGHALVSVSDDGLLRQWDLNNTQGPQRVYQGHGDAIRSVVVWQQKSSTTLAFTGSYDHTIRVWNLDAPADDETCQAVWSHEAPVEALLLLPRGDDADSVWLVSVGGTTLKVWHPVTGQCVCTLATPHRKTIRSIIQVPRTQYTSASLKETTTTWRLATAGLDGLVRFYGWDAATGQVWHVHGVRMPWPLTAMAYHQNRLALGTVDGRIVVRQKGPSVTSKARRTAPPAGTFAHFQRGSNASAPADAYVVVEDRQSKRRKTNAAWDVALRQFRHADALDEALQTRNPQIVLNMLEELGKRRGLAVALRHRDEESLEPILAFCVRYIRRPRYAAILVGVANLLLDVYGGKSIMGQSEVIDELFDKLKKQVVEETRMHRQLFQLVGQMDGMLAKAELEDWDDDDGIDGDAA